MDLILYSPNDPIFPPPHKAPNELYFGNRSSLQDPRSWDSKREAEDKHQRCIAGETLGEECEKWRVKMRCSGEKHCPIHQLHACAACNWDSAPMAKLRIEKKRRVRDFERTGKLPPMPRGFVWPKRYVLDAHNLPQLPRFNMDAIAWPPKLRPDDMNLRDIHNRYLEAMHKGKKRVQESFVWTCGCVTWATTISGTSSGGIKESCDKHKRAFEGREED